MSRYEVIESKVWRRDDGATASIYGAVPWTSTREEPRWKMITRGYTVRDNERGTVGIGRQPWATRAEAQAWVDKEEARLAEARAWATKKTPAQLQQEIDDALAARKTAKRFQREDAAAARQPKTPRGRAHATVKRAVPGIGKWNTYAGGTAAAAGKHSYDLYVPEGQYTISPISSRHGRHVGYSLKFAGTHGRPRGSHGGLWHDLEMHSSPQIAASAAAKHYAAGFEGS